MSQSDGALVELDQTGVDILRALVQHDGTATSTELRKFLGLDSTTKFNYRVREYLAPEGLIKTHQPEPEPGGFPPKEITLTEHGKEYLEGLDSGDRNSGGIADRLDRLEEQVEGLRQENQELREENQELKEMIEGSDVEMVTGRVQELTDDVDRLQAKMSNMQEAIGETQSHPLIQSRETAEGFDAMLVMMNASRRIIEDEIEGGEERHEQERAEVQETLSERGRLLTEE